MSQNNAALPKGKTREFVGGSEQCSSSPPAPSSTRIRISSHAMWSMSESNPGDFAHCLPHIRTKQLSGCDDDCSHQALWVLHGSAVSGWWVGEREQQGRAPLQRCSAGIQNSESRIQNPNGGFADAICTLERRNTEFKIQNPESKWGAVGRDLYARAQEYRIQNPESRIQMGGLSDAICTFWRTLLRIQEYRIQNFLIWIRLTAYCTFTLR